MAEAQKRKGPESHELPGGTVPSTDKVYELLANKRRRYVIRYLKGQDGPVPLGLIAEQVAAWEEEVDTSEVTASQRKSVYTGLQQRHLPKMDDAGLVSFDRRRGTVEATQLLSELDMSTQNDTTEELPWCYYYLGLSAVSGAAVLASWAGLPLFSIVTHATWGVLCVVVLAISASIHVLTARGVQFGTDSVLPTRD